MSAPPGPPSPMYGIWTPILFSLYGPRSDDICYFKMKLRVPEQDEFDFLTWGGEREGAGRPRTRPDLQPHTARTPVARSYPVHVSIKLLVGKKSLRTYTFLSTMRAVLRA